MGDDMTVTEIGARIVQCEDGRRVAIFPLEQITIKQLERMARAYLANDSTPFVSASAFVLEMRHQWLNDGRSLPVQVKVHPDARVQKLLHQMREAAMERAVAEVREQAGGNIQVHQIFVLASELPQIVDAPWRELALVDIGARANAKRRAQREARHRLVAFFSSAAREARRVVASDRAPVQHAGE